MDIVLKGISCGKTTEAIKYAAEHNLYIVCRDKEECSRIHGISLDMGLRLHFPLTFMEYKRGNYHARGIKGVVIDNADLWLQYSSPDLPIKMITLTDNVGAFEYKYRKLLWLSHGHTSLYGDDGEMQCSQCKYWDYKRHPIEEIEGQIDTMRREELKKILAEQEGK